MGLASVQCTEIMKRLIAISIALALVADAAETATSAHPRPSPAKLQRALMDALACASSGLAGAAIGFDVIQISTGKALAQYNSQNQFIPASNAKLYSTATALMRLGPDYRYETHVAAATVPDASGRLAGNLYFIGAGDPTFNSRVYPLASPTGSGPLLRDIEALADQIFAAGVRRIDGSVVGDESAYPKDHYPMGWSVDDALWDYGAPVSALTIHDNLLTIRVAAPMATGALTRITLEPPLEYYTIDNRAVAGAETQVKMERLPGSRELRVSGTVAAGVTFSEALAIDDPARYAATALAEALERRGVSIRGGVSTRSRTVDEVPDPIHAPIVLATHTSGTLPGILMVVNKISHNLYAEMVLREVGRVVNGSGTRQAGLSEVYKLIWEAGARTECCYFQDGSGLSRQTLISPLATAKLLQYMYRAKYHDIWWSLLPIGGVDGTLRRHFEGNPEGKRLRAKSGSLAHVATMSGYVESTTWGPLAFSVLFNNYNAETAEATLLLDKIGLALLE